MWRRLRRWLIVAAVSTAGGLWLSQTLLTPEAGIGVARNAAPIRGLPANARNVTYFLRPPASYYEFDTDEAGFEDWAAGWELAWQRVEGRRWAVVWDHAAGRPGEAEVPDGVGYDWAKEDAGWSLTFDRRAGRAYCSGHYR